MCESRASVIQYAFAQFDPLPDPIVLDSEWLERPYYSIRLVYNNQTGAGNWGTHRSNYQLRVNLQSVPANQLSRAILLIFSDVFDICRRNTIAPVGTHYCRVHFKSESLNRNINFSRLDFNNKAQSLKRLETEINNVLQSNENFFLADDLQISFISYDIPPRYQNAPH
jgi:hypothetical protein